MAMCGALFHPVPATAIVFVGGTTGSLLAYAISHQLATSGVRQTRKQTGIANRMREGTTFSSLFALRICPGVPHAAINYTAGALQIPLHLFITSTAAGFLAKGIVYTSAVYRIAHIDTETNLLSFDVLWPLIALLSLALASIWIERKRTQRKQEDHRLKTEAPN